MSRSRACPLPGSAPWRRARRLGGSALALAALAALVVLGAAKINLPQVERALGHVNLSWIALAAGLMVAAFLARGESWFAALRAALPDRPPRRPTVTRALLIGMFCSSVAPGRVGEAARAWLIARRAGATRDALATVIGTLLSQTVLNVLALVILAVGALAGGAIPGAHTGALIALVAVPVGLLAIALLGPRLMLAGQRHPAGLPSRALSWIARQLRAVTQGLVGLRQPRVAMHCAGVQLAGWGLQLASCYAVLAAFGLQDKAGLATAAAILFAVNVTAVLPVTPSNVGVFQAACIAVLAPLGIRAGTGLAYGLVLQLVEVGCASALGLPALVKEGFSLGELSRQVTVMARPEAPVVTAQELPGGP